MKSTNKSSDASTTLELSRNISTVLEHLLRNYDNRQRPDHGGSPTIVTTNFLIRSMGPISELDMEYSMDCYFRQKWTDR
ncbi:Gamma-aminobutyric acid receptor alpha-like protein, partial [Stegodyphus mimosarum]